MVPATGPRRPAVGSTTPWPGGSPDPVTGHSRPGLRRHRDGRRLPGCWAPPTSRARCPYVPWASVTSTTRHSGSSGSTPRPPWGRRCSSPRARWRCRSWSPRRSPGRSTCLSSRAGASLGTAELASTSALVLGLGAAVGRHDPGHRDDRPRHRRRRRRTAADPQRGVARDPRKALATDRHVTPAGAGVDSSARGVRRRVVRRGPRRGRRVAGRALGPADRAGLHLPVPVALDPGGLPARPGADAGGDRRVRRARARVPAQPSSVLADLRHRPPDRARHRAREPGARHAARADRRGGERRRSARSTSCSAWSSFRPSRRCWRPPSSRRSAGP